MPIKQVEICLCSRQGMVAEQVLPLCVTLVHYLQNIYTIGIIADAVMFQ